MVFAVCSIVEHSFLQKRRYSRGRPAAFCDLGEHLRVLGIFFFKGAQVILHLGAGGGYGAPPDGKGGAVAHIKGGLQRKVLVPHRKEPLVQLVGHLAVAHKGLGEGVGGEDIFGLEELHGEVVGAGTEKPKARLSLMGVAGSWQFLK